MLCRTSMVAEHCDLQLELFRRRLPNSAHAMRDWKDRAKAQIQPDDTARIARLLRFSNLERSVGIRQAVPAVQELVRASDSASHLGQRSRQLMLRWCMLEYKRETSASNPW